MDDNEVVIDMPRMQHEEVEQDELGSREEYQNYRSVEPSTKQDPVANSGSRISNVEYPVTINEAVKVMSDHQKSCDKDFPENSRYPGRKRNKPKRMNISVNDRYTKRYDLGLVQLACMNQLVEIAEGKRMSMNRGMRIWGDRGVDAVLGELDQIHNRQFFTPMDPKELTCKEKRKLWSNIYF